MAILFNGGWGIKFNLVKFDPMRYHPMRRFFDLPAILFAISMMFSCSRESCPFSSGDRVSDTRRLANFTEIVLYDKINLILQQDTAQSVRVEAGSNLVTGIGAVVSNGVLTIQDNNACNWARTGEDPANVYISSGRLQKITYYGAGNVSSADTLRATLFTVDCWSGSGAITLSLAADTVYALVRTENATITLNGHADSAYIYCGQAGSIDLFNLATRAVALDSKSVRDMDVNVSSALHANIVYKGNVYYKGLPETIQTLITSSGRLIHVP
jgi:Putative auto-transporter adhesin, head GIN domain